VEPGYWSRFDGDPGAEGNKFRSCGNLGVALDLAVAVRAWQHAKPRPVMFVSEGDSRVDDNTSSN
jgi:hypothetical protein